MKKFLLGKRVITQGADDTITHTQAIELLERHQSGDWGDMCAEDKRANDNAINNEERIFSAYIINETKVWVITEADRSVTTILLPSEY